MVERCLQIPLSEIDPELTLSIYPEGSSDFRIIDALESKESSESTYQILEGNTYEYSFNKNSYQLKTNIPGIVIPSKNHHLWQILHSHHLQHPQHCLDL